MMDVYYLEITVIESGTEQIDFYLQTAKKRPSIAAKSLICMLSRPRLERGTNGLKVRS